MKNHTNPKFAIAAAAITAFLAAVSFTASADDVKAGGPSTKAPRALVDGPVKSEGASTKSGRVPSINDPDVKTGGVKKQSRSIDDGAVKTAEGTDKPGRTADEGAPKVKTGGVKQQPRSIDDGTVKSGGTSDKPGRALDTAKK